LQSSPPRFIAHCCYWQYILLRPCHVSYILACFTDFWKKYKEAYEIAILHFSP
jgi:hypothetical protein